MVCACVPHSEAVFQGRKSMGETGESQMKTTTAGRRVLRDGKPVDYDDYHDEHGDCSCEGDDTETAVLRAVLTAPGDYDDKEVRLPACGECKGVKSLSEA